jgi:hypothetical protein
MADLSSGPSNDTGHAWLGALLLVILILSALSIVLEVVKPTPEGGTDSTRSLILVPQPRS